MYGKVDDLNDCFGQHIGAVSICRDTPYQDIALAHGSGSDHPYQL